MKAMFSDPNLIKSMMQPDNLSKAFEMMGQGGGGMGGFPPGMMDYGDEDDYGEEDD
jgi:hypothetical protein